MFAFGAMIVGWILNLSPRIKIRFLLWTLFCGTGFCVYIYQASLAHNTRLGLYTYTMGHYHPRNLSVRNYSIHRKREIEKRKEREKQRENSTGGGSSYSGGASHYGGGLSGGK